MSPWPLDGVRVLDLTQYVAGPYCTQVLADLGATVLKLERPGTGDVYRRQGPVYAGGESASFLTLNRGKRSLELDLGSEETRSQLEGLIGEADVLVENMRPGALAKLGLDYTSLAPQHPRLIYCSISAFGQEGPRSGDGGYDLTLQALSGLMAATGHPGQAPVKIPVAALDFGSALYATIGILAALAERGRTGCGQWVQTSLLETALAWFSMHVVTYLLGGGEPQLTGSRSPFFAPYEAYQTADGHVVVVGTGGRDAWPLFCRTLGLDHLVNDERFVENADRVRHAEELRIEVEAVTGTRTTTEWTEAFAAAGVVSAPVQTLPQVLDDPQTHALQMIGTLDHPTAGAIPSVRLPVTMSESRTTASDPPPLLGEGGEFGFGASGDSSP